MKRIVICADGTWNERDRIDKKTGRRHPTNVTKVARGVLPQAADGTAQVVYYHEGVGTGGGLDKFTGGAFGEGVEANIRALYRFIVYNYVEGDELFFFGFSRGAFTVRTLAGFMSYVNLVEKDDDYYVPEIYACYEKGVREGSPEWTKAFHNVRGTRPCPPIRFVGVWDTVGALGAPGLIGQLFNKDKYKYHQTGLMNSPIQNAFHALAIDERRKPFAPDIWEKPAGWAGQLEQAWFAGVHSNVGGSYAPDGLANEALHWIVEKAENLGLEFDKPYLAHFLPCFNSVLNDSMTAVYKVMGPNVRTLGRHAADGEALHQSAIDRKRLAECRYAPENLETVLTKGGTLKVVDTTRIARGTPCPPLS
ncbi:MAG: DUF2235 domain-containing protein [Candidatus Accumulibacter sp.]|uniref:DUF2235 domain-containing protein n=1 Tax=Candidatus Accumulibacter affinis TaxID=2954384 RepID=A0A935TB88_9PROT|nr:DUF2235 domain-containing protein [Candidatus Accumulibacter affinis]MBP9804129.1 DUF2235 domain-containing protein [Accumulibacter sp.]